MNEALRPIFQKIVDDSTNTITSTIQSAVADLKRYIQGSLTSGIHQLIEVTTSGSGVIPLFSAPVLRVPPGLKAMIHRTFFPHCETFQFTCPQQAEGIASVLTNDHVFVILPTAGGKSLIFFAAPAVRPACYIVIVPLISLLQDMKRRADLYPGYQAVIWKEENFDFDRPGIVFVPAHEAGTDSFRHWVHLPGVTPSIKRIFIDECHHLVTDIKFRECFLRLVFLTALKIPFTFLSGTLRPNDIPIALEILQIQPSAPIREIRASTARLNHIYTHEQVHPDNLDRAVLSWVQARNALEGQSRGLIFVSSKPQCERLAGILGIEFFHSNLTRERKGEIAQQWRNGFKYSDRLLVATSAFGEGIDWPSVTWVLSIDPFGIISLVQWEGRAGRDGSPAECHTMFTRLPKLDVTLGFQSDPQGIVPLIKRLTGGECIRLSQETLDREVHTCSALADAQLCQNCKNVSSDVVFQCCLWVF